MNITPEAYKREAYLSWLSIMNQQPFVGQEYNNWYEPHQMRPNSLVSMAEDYHAMAQFQMAHSINGGFIGQRGFNLTGTNLDNQIPLTPKLQIKQQYCDPSQFMMPVADNTIPAIKYQDSGSGSDISEEQISQYTTKRKKKRKDKQIFQKRRLTERLKTSRAKIYRAFKIVVNSPKSSTPYDEIVRKYEASLTQEVNKFVTERHGQFEQKYFDKELIMARKNLTNHFIKILRYSVVLLKETIGRTKQIENLQTTIKQTSINIACFLKIYRTPEFSFFVDFLKQKIMVRQKLPQLIMTLDVKHSGKLVMLSAIQGFIDSVYQPHTEVVSWNTNSQQIIGDTSTLAEQIKKTPTITFEEISRKFSLIYLDLQRKRPEIAKCSKYNNISYHYRSKLIRILNRLAEDERYTHLTESISELKNLASKTCSIENIKEMLSVKWFSLYLRQHEIENNVFLYDLMYNKVINCSTKKIILESYPKFAIAIEEPETFIGWQ